MAPRRRSSRRNPLSLAPVDPRRLAPLLPFLWPDDKERMRMVGLLAEKVLAEHGYPAPTTKVPYERLAEAKWLLKEFAKQDKGLDLQRTMLQLLQDPWEAALIADKDVHPEWMLATVAAVVPFVDLGTAVLGWIDAGLTATGQVKGRDIKNVEVMVREGFRGSLSTERLTEAGRLANRIRESYQSDLDSGGSYGDGAFEYAVYAMVAIAEMLQILKTQKTWDVDGLALERTARNASVVRKAFGKPSLLLLMQPQFA